MTAIHVLHTELVNQIAAGEVVERPASVVKELVENALDAGAGRVDVAITGGGIGWISVTDDGSGLARADVELAFQRHATSKIRSASDLAQVTTLGFRGEALSSIASVAKVRMRTRRADDPVGTEGEGGSGGPIRLGEIACPAGTRVEIAELFERIPARRKFLKTATTESTHIVRWLERIALARPDVHFTLERDGRASLAFLPTRNPKERAIAVLPPSVGERLVAIGGKGPGADVSGFTSPTDVSRGSSADIHLFVNGRPVRDRLLLFAVRDAYRDALPPGRHPIAVVQLRVDPDGLDVNVHPAKLEVRFRDPRAISRLVRDSLIRSLGLRARAPRPDAADGLRADSAPSGIPSPAEFAWAGRPSGSILRETDEGFFGLSPAAAAEQRPQIALGAHRYLGQALGNYLILERPGGLLLLDQHAAHERVLFERLRRGLSVEKLERQALLTPVWVELPESAAQALLEASDLLARAGFELEVADRSARGGVRVGVREVPAILAARVGMSWTDLLVETATGLRDPELRDARDGIEGALHAVLATAACHSAIRKGDRIEGREVDALLEALDEEVWFPNCPHGRPILCEFDEAEIERRFLRR